MCIANLNKLKRVRTVCGSSTPSLHTHSLHLLLLLLLNPIINLTYRYSNSELTRQLHIDITYSLYRHTSMYIYYMFILLRHTSLVLAYARLCNGSMTSCDVTYMCAQGDSPTHSCRQQSKLSFYCCRYKL